jgi:hypothetical protein
VAPPRPRQTAIDLTPPTRCRGVFTTANRQAINPSIDIKMLCVTGRLTTLITCTQRIHAAFCRSRRNPMTTRNRAGVKRAPVHDTPNTVERPACPTQARGSRFAPARHKTDPVPLSVARGRCLVFAQASVFPSGECRTEPVNGWVPAPSTRGRRRPYPVVPFVRRPCRRCAPGLRRSRGRSAAASRPRIRSAAC